MSAVYANSSNQIAALKELYTDDKDYMKDLVYKENPFLALVPKNESPDGFAGKYIPVPLEYGTPQGRSHAFANAQNQQTATSLASYFVYVISDYQLVTITNLLMEQTKTNAGAFVDGAKLQMDGGFRNITNNIAFELFGDGTGTRGFPTIDRRQRFTSLGYISFAGEMDLSITIRTYAINHHLVTFQTGGAVTIDSDPNEEYEETLTKARALHRTLTQKPNS